MTETVQETEPEEVHFYEWIENYEINDFVGNIHVSVNNGSKEISTVVNFGGSEDSYIDNNAGLHEQISNKDELFILGHHMKNGTIFANLVYAQVGDIITFDTLEGEYVYVITDSFHVNVEEYEANDFAVCRGHDITLVTCDYGYGATGRHLVYGNLVSINGTIVESAE
jgi:LPXTG-site transpeptidase (sortase) family protein